MMNSKARQRALRSFLASLLQSDLSIREMTELADDLSYGSFGRELADFIRDAIHVTDSERHRAPRLRNSATEASDYPALKAALSTISRRKLSKRMIIQIMSLASPWVKPANIENTDTVRDIVEQYLIVASAAEASKFLNILEGEPADAYMKGIARRERSK